MYRVIERDNRFYIQKRTIFGWSYLSKDDFKFKYNEIYGIYLPLIISIISLFLYLMAFEIITLTIIFATLSYIGILFSVIRLISKSKYYMYTLEDAKLFIINHKKDKEKKKLKKKSKIYYLDIKDERIEKLRKI